MLVIFTLFISSHLSFLKTLVKTKDSQKRKLLIKYYKNVMVLHTDCVDYITRKLAKKEELPENMLFINYTLKKVDEHDYEAVDMFKKP